MAVFVKISVNGSTGTREDGRHPTSRKAFSRVSNRYVTCASIATALAHHVVFRHPAFKRSKVLKMRTWIAVVMVLVGFTSASISAADSSSAITVFAAASLTDALQQIGEEFSKTTHTTVRFSFAASSALARQIESGAAVDVFVSADQEWMDYLDSRKLIEPGTRRDVVGNRLALVAPAVSKLALKIQPHFALLAALGPNGRLATADPDSVPVGKYAKAALTSLGVWPQIESRLVRAENVRAALAF